jgi:Holliday junction resolvasome RuvABC endonuclease subunit
VIKGKSITDCVTDYVNQYEINVIAIKKLHASRSSKALRRITNEIENFAIKQKLDFHEYSINELKENLLSETLGNKRILMEAVSERYPFLMADCQKEVKNKNPYFVRMFEAIALGIVCFNAVDTGTEKVEIKRS